MFSDMFNNFFIKNKDPKLNEYLNLSSMIKELKELRMNKNLLSEFSTTDQVINKRRVKVEDMVKFLRLSSEKNKSINIGDKEESAVMTKTLDSFFEDNCEKRFKEYYIEINIIRLNEQALGYDIDLEPVREETRYYPGLEVKLINNYQYYEPTKKIFYNKGEKFDEDEETNETNTSNNF